jgi:hypothetical protein
MAHFAKLDENNVVVEVIAVANKELLDNGVESEAKGIEFCKSLFGGNWIQTSYNGNIRYNYAGVGFKYDETKDAFISPEPEDALGFDESTCQWIVPGIVDES